MLVIRQAQMAALSESIKERFVIRAAAQLESGQHAHPPVDGDYHALVRRVIGKAARHGIEDEQDVLYLAELMLSWGEDFELREDLSWVRTVLEHPRLPSWGKVQRIRAEMDFRERAAEE